MIVYRLQCSKGHSFDEWFASSDDYAERAGNGGVVCPECGDTQVSKAIMAPNIGGGTSTAPETPCASCGEGGFCPLAG